MLGGCCWEGQGDRLERRGLGEVLRGHPKPGTSGICRFGVEPSEGGCPDPSQAWYLVLPSPVGVCRVGKVISHLWPPHPLKEDNLTTPSPPFSVIPTTIKPCCPLFPSPSTSLGRKSATSSQARVPEAIYKKQELKGKAQPSWQKHLWV